MDILRQNILFSGLDEEQFTRVVGSSKVIKLKEGEMLFEQQQAAEYFYF